jgi:hypothetical protein
MPWVAQMQRRLAEVTRAYATKYSGNPYVQPLLEEPAAGATLQLDPS